jgi:hypothetical protein
MTAQIPDEFIYNGEVFSLVGLKGEGLPAPEDFGIISYSNCTGFQRPMAYKKVIEIKIENGTIISAKDLWKKRKSIEM